MLKLANNEIAKLQLYIYYFSPIRLPIIKWNTYTVGENVEKQALSNITHTSAKQCNIYRGQFDSTYKNYKHIYYLM